MSIKLIIGLKNPGSAYHQTRHNAGGWFVQSLVRHCNGHLKIDKKLQGEIAQCEWRDIPFKAFLPTTFMNHSGRAVRAACQFYKIDTSEILVVHDELDLEPGRIKLKTGGGHGGHNGLRDIAAMLGTVQFHRLRIGIGHPGHKDLVTSYVLGKPSQQERQLIHDAIERGFNCMPAILQGDIAIAMNQLNS